MMRWILLLALTSCGFYQVVIPNLDLAIHHQIRKRYDLDRKQQQKLHEDIDTFLNEIRPFVKDKLLPLIKDIQSSDLKKIDLNIYRDRFSTIYQEFTDRFARFTVKYLKQASRSQRDHFYKEFKEQNIKIKKRSEKYDISRVKERIEFIIGDLSADQIFILKEMKPLFQMRNKQRLENRLWLISQLEAIDYQSISEETLYQLFKQYNEKVKNSFNHQNSMQSMQGFSKLFHLCDQKQTKAFNDFSIKSNEWLLYFINYEF